MESGTKCTTLLINAISKELSKGKDKTQLPYVSCHRLLCLFLLSFWPSHQSVHFYIDLYFTVTHLKDKPFFFFSQTTRQYILCYYNDMYSSKKWTTFIIRKGFNLSKVTNLLMQNRHIITFHHQFKIKRQTKKRRNVTLLKVKKKLIKEMLNFLNSN